ncbi:DNA primase [Actinotignum urinale]|uniref:DNA primase n=1 Tax=Actinotignum urinale TaxID=190146 RepID=A0ABU5G4C2_9ACTO|nr:DNA primase [Actinotignum urinale]MDY5132228.1 DNA primase [Actinotignum urinale]MDY5151327.1 DNA primase [Actinotignum urinale]WIK58872.1 DNA primase [Actinotignum urinale]
MAGRVRKEDIERVKTTARIEEVVSQYVTLKNSGADSMVALCPFHDEKTPSFNVRPNAGYYHCFGCGENGDVIDFVQKQENTSFIEAVEVLARRYGVELHYEEGSFRQGTPQGPKKARMIDAHRAAVVFYRKQLRTPEGKQALQLLTERGFDDAAIAHFNIGYSPQSWDSLYKELRKSGFTDAEIETAGLATRGNRGLYDRFRGRLMWPIFSITGDPIGFGARKISDDDNGPKYLNTPETPIYHKAQVLYGLNLAKKSIAEERRIVIVEGYTDVMAAHLSGVETAVATCGTAFGHEHVKIARRLLRDTNNPAAGILFSTGQSFGGEVIFTFDGDAAGQKAALRAFKEDQSFAAQTFVAISPGGMDPCDMRMKLGEDALRELVESRRPLFDFVIDSVLRNLPLNTPEGRSVGLQAGAPIVAGIRDRVIREGYIRIFAGKLGVDEKIVRGAVLEAYHKGGMKVLTQGGVPQQAEQEAPRVPGIRLPDLDDIKDPVEKSERAALQIYLQLPAFADNVEMDKLPENTFVTPTYRSIHDAIRAAGGTHTFMTHQAEAQARGVAEGDAERYATTQYISAVKEQAGPALALAVSQITAEPLPIGNPDNVMKYAWEVVVGIIRQGVIRQIAEARSALMRMPENDPSRRVAAERLVALEKQKRQCEEQMGIGS